MEYFVKSNFRFNGRRYLPGDSITMNDGDAKQALASGALSIEPVVAPEMAPAPAAHQDTQDAPAQPSVGGDPVNTGEASVDGQQQASQPRTEAVDVTPVTADMKRDELEAVALAEGHSQDAIDACGTKASLVELIDAGRNPVPAPATDEKDPSANL